LALPRNLFEANSRFAGEEGYAGGGTVSSHLDPDRGWVWREKPAPLKTARVRHPTFPYSPVLSARSRTLFPINVYPYIIILKDFFGRCVWLPWFYPEVEP
jgi:hypothetical protein